MKRILEVVMLSALLLASVCGCGSALGDTTTTEKSAETAATYLIRDEKGKELLLPAEEYRLLSVAEYVDKTTAGFLAQLVGTLSGYEFVTLPGGRGRVAMPDSWFAMCQGPYAKKNEHKTHTVKLLKNADGTLWEVWNDDDFGIDVVNQYILADMYKIYGTLFSRSVSEGWKKYDVYDMGGGQRTVGAYGLINRNGYLPQFSGNAEFENMYSYCTEPYLGADTLGMDAAGMPETAFRLSGMCASVTGDRDNVGWAQMFAVMMSLAYFEKDIPTLIREAEKVFPTGAYQLTVVDEVFELYRTYPDNWRAAYSELERRHYLAGQTKMTDSTINAGFVLLDLLYGEGDYTETCRIGSLAGYDCESTVGIALSVVAIIGGMEKNPETVNQYVWQDGNGVFVNRPLGDKTGYWMCAMKLPERMKISDIIEKYRTNFESVLVENGGYICDGIYYIPKETLLRYDAIPPENNGFETGDLTGYTVNTGTVKVGNLATTGEYAAELYGTAELCTTIKGLTVGASYRFSAFLCTADGVNGYLYVRSGGKTVAVSANSVTAPTKYEAQNTVRRELIFRAEAETAELGFRVERVDGDASKSAACSGRIDELLLVRVEETLIAGGSLGELDASGRQLVALDIPDGRENTEQLLRITYENPSSILAEELVVDGRKYGGIGFSATAAQGKIYTATDSISVRLLLKSGTHTLKIGTGKGNVLIKKAEYLTVKDRY